MARLDHLTDIAGNNLLGFAGFQRNFNLLSKRPARTSRTIAPAGLALQPHNGEPKLFDTIG
jgi:hypothetical protein